MWNFLLIVFIGGGLVGGWIALLSFGTNVFLAWRKVRKSAVSPASLPPVDPTPYTSGAETRPLIKPAYLVRPCSVCSKSYDPGTRPVDRFRFLACSDTCCRVVESRFDAASLVTDLPEETS